MKARFILILALPLLFCACHRKIGWGVLLWAQTAKAAADASSGTAAVMADIPSGAVVPVYARSNIEKKWIAGVPRQYRRGIHGSLMFEIPLPLLHLTRTKVGAKRWAKNNLGDYVLMYAETLQDGLPVRSQAENGSQRVYRLRAGEIIKILSVVEGVAAVGASGDPLPGQWFNVLTADGTRGYCFSYRLRLFDNAGGEQRINLAENAVAAGGAADSALDAVIAKRWSASEYWDMINENKIVIEDIEKGWGFSFGEDTGIANIYTPSLDRSFRYTGIRRDGGLRWRFDGTSLRVEQTGENQIRVEFNEQNDVYSPNAPVRVFNFYALPVKLSTLASDEKARRETLYRTLYKKGPVFTSEDYGVIYLTENHDFSWENYDALSGVVIPLAAIGRGRIDFVYFLGDELAGNFDGTATFKFATVNGPVRDVNFLYRYGNGELRLTPVRPEMIEGKTVAHRPSRMRGESSEGENGPPYYAFKTSIK
ncbi:MAG: SH3 domain-containing protein [Spirochaetaceae bacterium]|jgi:hypothetical protein|nr:SH3 domain-containing protein [Spirochaetaceae bacterium]